MRGDHRDPGRLGRLDLGHEHARVGAGQKVDQVRLLVDRGIHALDPLRALALILPDRELEADLLGGRGHRLLDVGGEGVGAGHRDAEDLLALHAFLGIERRPGRHELRLLEKRLELLLKVVEVIGPRRPPTAQEHGRRAENAGAEHAKAHRLSSLVCEHSLWPQRGTSRRPPPWHEMRAQAKANRRQIRRSDLTQSKKLASSGAKSATATRRRRRGWRSSSSSRARSAKRDRSFAPSENTITASGLYRARFCRGLVVDVLRSGRHDVPTIKEPTGSTAPGDSRSWHVGAKLVITATWD